MGANKPRKPKAKFFLKMEFSYQRSICFLLRLSDRNSFLETSLGEKEEKLLSLTEKLEQIETLRKQLQERDLLNKELGEKFMHSEQKVSY